MFCNIDFNHQTELTKTVDFKGQLILKGNFSAFNSPKNESENVIFFPSQPRAETFSSFSGRIEKTKKPF